MAFLTVRRRILAGVAGVLALFAVAACVTAFLVRGSIQEIGGISDYHEALGRELGDLDVDTFGYELLTRRLVDEPGDDATRTTALRQELEALRGRLATSLGRATDLVDRAAEDPRNDVADRLQFAHIGTRLDVLGRDLSRFTDLGKEIESTWAAGNRAEAHARLVGFASFERAFGPDLRAARQAVSDLTVQSTRETNTQQHVILYSVFGLFVGASVLGLVVFGMLTRRLQVAFAALIQALRRIGAGGDQAPLPVPSRDEIGELTESFNHMVQQLRTKDRIKDSYGKFFDPRIVAALVDEHGETQHVAERRPATIFFSDIAGFSRLSEDLTPDAVARVLNHYFTAMTDVVRKHNGIVDKYIGDAIMSFWTPPFSEGDAHAVEACRAALAQRAILDRIQSELPHIVGLRRNPPQLRVRMGLASGEVLVGIIGSDALRSYTVIGDIVNVAARLQATNKIYGTDVLITEDTFRLARESIEARELDLIVPQGKSEPVRVYELAALVGEAPAGWAAACAAFAAGLAAYRRRAWSEARDAFAECLRLRPSDGPASEYLRRLGVLIATPPPDDWDLVWKASWSQPGGAANEFTP